MGTLRKVATLLLALSLLSGCAVSWLDPGTGRLPDTVEVEEVAEEDAEVEPTAVLTTPAPDYWVVLYGEVPLRIDNPLGPGAYATLIPIPRDGPDDWLLKAKKDRQVLAWVLTPDGRGGLRILQTLEADEDIRVSGGEIQVVRRVNETASGYSLATDTYRFSPAEGRYVMPEPAPQPVICRKLDSKGAAELLAKLSSATPEERVEQTVGAARALFEEERTRIETGWPNVADWNLWRRNAWGEVLVEDEKDRTMVTLRHGDDATFARTTQFQFDCVEGQWMLSRIGGPDGWYVLPDVLLPGQQAERMTLELAKALLAKLAAVHGTSEARTFVTGAAAEEARLSAIRATYEGAAPSSAGSETDDLLARIGPLRQVEPDGDSAVARGASGEQIRFERHGGIWYVADYTDGGKWLSETYSGRKSPAPFSRDRSLVGIGFSARGNALFSLVLTEEGVPSPLLTARKIGLGYVGNQVVAISAGSGSTVRGLTIGDPVSYAAVLYGQPDMQLSDRWVYTDAGYRMELSVARDSSGVLRVRSVRISREGAAQ